MDANDRKKLDGKEGVLTEETVEKATRGLQRGMTSKMGRRTQQRISRWIKMKRKKTATVNPDKETKGTN